LSRYIAIPKTGTTAVHETTCPPLAHPQVFVDDPVKTGLIDKDGNPIYRLPDPIGFLAKKDRL
jgi:hypothetical protein